MDSSLFIRSSSNITFSISSSCSSSCPSSPSSSSSSFLTTPVVLLSLIAQYCRVTDLLRLLRSCSQLRRLHASDGSSSSSQQLWSAVLLSVQFNNSLRHSWPLTRGQVVRGTDGHDKRDDCIPLATWQKALPTMLDIAHRWHALYPHAVNSSALMGALTAEQPTITLWVRRGEELEECTVLDLLTMREVDEIVEHLPCFSTDFALAATPQLQHLHLQIGTVLPARPITDMFTLVPRLRSLHIDATNTNWSIKRPTPNSIVCIRDMLAALSSLAQLHCTNLLLDMQDLIDIAAHATLEDIALNPLSDDIHAQYALGHSIDFNSDDSTDDDTNQAADSSTTDDVEMNHAAVNGSSKEAEQHKRDMERLPIALTRVPPSYRSVRARLSLANFIRRQLLRSRSTIEQRRNVPQYFQLFRIVRNNDHRALDTTRQLLRQVTTLRDTLSTQLSSFILVSHEVD